MAAPILQLISARLGNRISPARLAHRKPVQKGASPDSAFSKLDSLSRLHIKGSITLVSADPPLHVDTKFSPEYFGILPNAKDRLVLADIFEEGLFLQHRFEKCACCGQKQTKRKQQGIVNRRFGNT
jgi:hypothetical protein